MIALLIGLGLSILNAAVATAFDATDYRQATYGAPTHYCDPARSLASSGAGTLGDPWNLTQCQSQPVAGNVVGLLPGVGVALVSADGDNIPTFQPTNSGTAGNPIVYVAKYAAVALSNIASNANRTQLTHDGTAASVTADVESGTGSPMYGVNNKDYVVYDGIYVDEASAHTCGDCGMIRFEDCTGCQALNFVLKGATVNCQSNPSMLRSQATLDLVFKNFILTDFANDGTGSSLPQKGFAFIGYGDRNITIEQFEVTNVERGIFPKGSNPLGVNYNYGVFRYGKFYIVQQCFQLNDMDDSNTMEVHHNLCDTFSVRGVSISSETRSARNLLLHHNTFVRGAAGGADFQAVITNAGNGFTGSSNTIRDNIFDVDSGSNGYLISFTPSVSSLPSTMNYNGYYKVSGSPTEWARDATTYTSLANWQAGVSLDANSQILTDPFVSRAGADFRISGGHAALTASSTGGEIGAYEGGATLGVDVTPSSNRRFSPSFLRRASYGVEP